MVGERVPEGLLVRLKPSGVARFFPAAFLALWLCGWAFGECFALYFLAKGVLAIINGTPFEEGHSGAGLGFTIGAGAFLLFWLTLWTLGGLGAMAEFLRLVWSEDRFTASGAGLKLSRSLGPFHFHKEFQRDEVREISTAARNGALVADTTKGRFELSRSGTLNDREEAAAAIRSELGLAAAPTNATLAAVPGLAAAADTTPAQPPKGWQELITPEGERALVPDPAIRRRQAGLVSILGIAMVGIALYAVMQLEERGLPALPGALITTFFAVLLAAAAAWLSKGRMEWRIGSGRITQRRRFGSSVKDMFEATRLEILVESGSEHQDWFGLYACNNEPDPKPYASVQRLSVLQKNRRRIATVIRDPLVPRQLGAWLARAASVPLEDKTTPEARAMDLKALEEQLAQSGPLGKLAARFISSADQKRKSA
jgi:hypothetical protein